MEKPGETQQEEVNEEVKSADVTQKESTQEVGENPIHEPGEEGSELVKVRKQFGNEQKFNAMGFPRCALCGQHPEDMQAHLQEHHGMAVNEYRAKFPGWPILPELTSLGEGLSFRARKERNYDVFDTFGFPWPTGAKKMVVGFEEPGPLTPEIDDGYVFPPEATQVALLGLHLKNKCLTFGPTGSGKTSLWEQIAARLNFNFVRINFDAGISRPDLVGQYVPKGGKMEFAYMTLPGTILVLDEWDSQGEECSFVLQRPLEKRSQLLIMEKGDELISLHPMNIIVATANTQGMGDDSGLYVGTRMQNYAQINRFELTIELDYLPPEEEEQILLKRFDDDIDDMEARSLVHVANKIREAFVKGELAAPLSTRDLINWAEKYCIWGEPDRSAKYCFINRSPYEDRAVMYGIISRAFDDEDD